MKNIILLTALFFTTFIFGQDDKKYIINDNIVTQITYHSNNSINQIGTYKNGKLDGTWIQYDDRGNKKAIGFYENGKKVGKWLYFNETKLTEVNFDDSKIVSVVNWNRQLADN